MDFIFFPINLRDLILHIAPIMALESMNNARFGIDPGIGRKILRIIGEPTIISAIGSPGNLLITFAAPKRVFIIVVWKSCPYLSLIINEQLVKYESPWYRANL